MYRQGYSTDSISLSDVGSAVKLSSAFKLVLADYDDQQMVLDNVSQLKILPTSSSYKLLGTNVAKVDSGVADFTDLMFVGKPGSQRVTFSVDSKSLDRSKISQLYGASAFSSSIFVSFRYCMPGEQSQNDECLTCSPGSYSFVWNSTQCSNCIDNAV